MTATEPKMNGKHELTPLPFRLVPDQQDGGHGIEFAEEVVAPFDHKKRLVTYTIFMGRRHGNIPVPQILQLMSMYRDMEATVAGLMKERDAALADKTVAEGEASRANSRVEEYKRQIANLKKDKGGS